MLRLTEHMSRISIFRKKKKNFLAYGRSTRIAEGGQNILNVYNDSEREVKIRQTVHNFRISGDATLVSANPRPPRTTGGTKSPRGHAFHLHTSIINKLRLHSGKIYLRRILRVYANAAGDQIVRLL